MGAAGDRRGEGGVGGEIAKQGTEVGGREPGLGEGGHAAAPVMDEVGDLLGVHAVADAGKRGEGGRDALHLFAVADGAVLLVDLGAVGVGGVDRGLLRREDDGGGDDAQ